MSRYYYHNGQYAYHDGQYAFGDGSPAVVSFLQLTTDASFIVDVSSSTFSPDFTVSSGTLHWDLGDGSILDTNSVDHPYIVLGNKNVNVYVGTTIGPESITEVKLENDRLIGTLDLEDFSNLEGMFYVHNNPGLTQIKNPSTAGVFKVYWAHGCNLTGTLDLTGLTNLGGLFYAQNNSNLTEILNPDSSQGIIYYWALNCNLTGTLDVSGLTGLGGSFNVHSNSNLTSILNPTSSQVFETYQAYSCNLTGTLDVSGLTGLGGSFYSYSNSGLVDILLPTLTQDITSFRSHNCALSQTTVDDVFSKLNTYYTSNSPSDDLLVEINGGTNAIPTDGASNSDITNLSSIFTGAGHTFTYYINS